MDLNDTHMTKPDIEYADNYVHNNSYLKGYVDGLNLVLGVRIDRKPFEGMTNGEVIQTVFPNITITDKSSNGVLIVVENFDSPYPHEFYADWWNAPYKAESEKSKHER